MSSYLVGRLGLAVWESAVWESAVWESAVLMGKEKSVQGPEKNGELSPLL